jgi:YtcA family
MQSRLIHAAVFALAIAGSGCDPVLNVFGSFFPAWVVCTVTGIALALVLRFLFAAFRLEGHLGPLALVYPSLALLLTMLVWLVFYRP